MTDFLDTPWTSLSEIPNQKTEAYSVLVKTLSLALREQENKHLRFEAANLLIQLNAHAELTRWDNMSYRRTLHEMLTDGTAEEQLFAALSISSSKSPDYESISAVVEMGLGNIDPEKTEESKKVLLDLSKRYIPVLFDVLLKNCENTSWRLRKDVIDLFCRWIAKLARFKSYQNGKRTTRAIDLSTVNPMFENAVQKAVQALLSLMWYDWSPEVRTTATNALSEMGIGRPIFDWVVKQLGDPDPGKRVEALRCFGKLRILTADSLKSLMITLDDPYVSVRVQACKVACVIATNNRPLINKLLEKCDDFEWKVRAYSIKGKKNKQKNI